LLQKSSQVWRKLKPNLVSLLGAMGLLLVIILTLQPLLLSAASSTMQNEQLITADRLAEFAWRTFVNPSSADTPPKLNLAPVVAHRCHTRPGSNLRPEQAAAPALGQGWTLNADKTIRVATHPTFCLDIDGARTTAGTPLITYPCNNISIHSVHNQQFEYAAGGNHSIRSVLSGLCLDRGPTGHPSIITMEACTSTASQQWSVEPPAGASPGATVREIASVAGGVCLVRKTHLSRHFLLKMIVLPRQARDKHRETFRKEGVLCRSGEMRALDLLGAWSLKPIAWWSDWPRSTPE
jgi:hypothetical protein